MTLVRTIVRELIGLFVDDGNFALAIVGIVLLAIGGAGVDAPMPVTGGTLIVGCIGVLAWSVLAASNKSDAG
jgi:hypothetical protein